MRLFRISNILFLGVATCFGVMLFWTSQAVQKKENELTSVKKELAHEEDTLRVLGVEWDYLNRPQRLEKMAIEQLGMELPSAKEVVKYVNDIPEPPPQIFDEGTAQNVSLTPAVAAPAEPKKEVVVSPSKAEKQSFDKLIQSLDVESGQ